MVLIYCVLSRRLKFNRRSFRWLMQSREGLSSETRALGVSRASGGTAKMSGEATGDRTVRSLAASPVAFAAPPLAGETPKGGPSRRLSSTSNQ